MNRIKSAMNRIKNSWVNMSGLQKMASVGIALLLWCVGGLVVLKLVSTRKGEKVELEKVELKELSVDSSGYICVEEGQKIHFPIKRRGLDSETFLPEDFLEIVGVLGSPADPKSRLTDFGKGDIWLVLKLHSSPAKMFIFRLRTNPLVIKPKKSIFELYVPPILSREMSSGAEQKNMERLAGLFMTGYFFNASKPITQTTDLFLYVELRPKGAFAKVKKLPSDLKVNCNQPEDCLYAETFNKKPENKDRLVIGLQEFRTFRYPYIAHSDFNKACYYQVRIVTKDDIKRPRSDGLLPR